MKDNRPSRKESKAQSNIREYLQDIAMGSTTHFSSSTVGKWRRRYGDFEKSEKQAWNDFEAFFDGVPTVNEVQAPEIYDYTEMQRYDKSITVPTEIVDVIHYRESIDDKIVGLIIVGFSIASAILGRAGHYLYSVM